MNQEPKPTIEQLLDERFILAKIATPGYSVYLMKEQNGTYLATCCGNSSQSCPTATEALTALKDRLYVRAAAIKNEVQHKLQDIQQQLNELNTIAEGYHQ